MFVKIYSGRVPNANKTLKKTIKTQSLIERINNYSLRLRINEFKNHNEINLWDLGKKAIKEITIGENLAITCSDSIYVGKIIGTIYDEKGEIGDIVGWAKQYKKLWQNVIILENVKTIPQNERIQSFIRDVNIYPYKIFNNFCRIREKEEKRFYTLFSLGSYEEQKEFSSRNKLNISNWIECIINDIGKLKKYSTHQERSHESLIERFFENLGYNRFSDIQFRIGRIDITISIDKKPMIVIEVKRYWNLNVKNDQNVIQQAYNYALKNGARFVIVSNGDYYAIFDRDRGRTYKENLMGDYRLTNIQKEDLKLINFLEKKNLSKYEL